MNTTAHGRTDPAEVQRYADAVRSALLDVAPAHREELLEDLVDHLREVAAEGDGPLAERLGSPQAYAQELRASLDLPPAGQRPAVVPVDEQLRRLYTRARGTRLGAELAAYIPTLRPAWWLVRAWLVVLTLAAMSGFRPFGAFSVVIPRIGESRLLGFVALVLLSATSVRLGQRERPARYRDAWVALNALVLMAGALAAAGLVGRTTYNYVVSPAAVAPGQNQHGQALVLDRNGNPVTNLEARSPDGKRIDGALIYTQDGLPLDNLADLGSDDMGRELVIHPERDAAGNVVHNSYPRRFDVVDPATGLQSPTAPPTGATGADPTPTATTASPAASSSASPLATTAGPGASAGVTAPGSAARRKVGPVPRASAR